VITFSRDQRRDSILGCHHVSGPPLPAVSTRERKKVRARSNRDAALSGIDRHGHPRLPLNFGGNRRVDRGDQRHCRSAHRRLVSHQSLSSSLDHLRGRGRRGGASGSGRRRPVHVQAPDDFPPVRHWNCNVLVTYIFILYSFNFYVFIHLSTSECRMNLEGRGGLNIGGAPASGSLARTWRVGWREIGR
jgi:hypothetical protein